LVAIHSADGFFRFLVVGHFHESESPWLSCVTVCYNRHLIDLPVRCKSLPKFFFTDVEIQIAYVNVLHIILFMLSADAGRGRFQVGCNAGTLKT
jgi:hypothetical protein